VITSRLYRALAQYAQHIVNTGIKLFHFGERIGSLKDAEYDEITLFRPEPSPGMVRIRGLPELR
jgi:hypothetical protein